MIPMGMRKNKMILKTAFLNQGIAKPPNPGARIDDDNVVAGGAYLQTGRVTAIYDIFFPGNRNGSPRSPTLDVHPVTTSKEGFDRSFSKRPIGRIECKK